MPNYTHDHNINVCMYDWKYATSLVRHGQVKIFYVYVAYVEGADVIYINVNFLRLLRLFGIHESIYQYSSSTLRKKIEAKGLKFM